MTTTYSYTAVIGGQVVYDTDVNTPFATIFAGLNSFDGGNIQTATIDGSAMKGVSISSAKLMNSTITATQMAANSIATAAVQDDAITTAKVLDGTLVNGNISATAAIALSKLAAHSGKAAFGTYTGLAVGQAITGVGFTPSLAIVFDNATNTVALFVKHSGHAGANCLNVVAQTTVTTAILSLDADGFTTGVHSDINNAARTYCWACFGSN